MVEGDGKLSQQQVARMLEQMILMQEPGYQPGWVLPSAASLARTLGLGEETVLGAYHVLANHGLVTLRRGYGAEVRAKRKREVIEVPVGSVVTARMPTFAEIDEWDLQPGVPMLVIGDQAWPADRFEIRTSTATGGIV